jgi:hypothetical protein
MTPGVAALGSEAVQRLVRTIAIFDDFGSANDPHGEHDFGAFDFDGTPVMFKIDYYDKSLEFGSPDPLIPQSPNGSSPSCWQKSIDRLTFTNPAAF